MKIKLFTITLALVSMNMSAQITVTDTDLISIGDIIYQAYDTVPAPSISIGNSGTNQSWDFSDLQVQEYDTIEFIDPTGTPFGADHPSANLCVDDEGEYTYFSKNAQSLSLVGFDDYPYPIMLAPLPLAYGLNTIVGPVIVMDSVFANPGFIDNSLAPAISLNSLDSQVDSLKIFIESSTEFNVDAHGNIIIPMGNFDALRVKTDDVNTTDFFAYCSDGLGNGAWHPIPAGLPGLPSSEVEITSSYAWWTNDPLIKFVLVQIEVDSLGGIDAVDFMHYPNPSSVVNLSDEDFNIYPIPTNNSLNIESQKNDLTAFELVDVTGKVILKKEFIQSTSLDVSHIAKGIYYLNLKTIEGELTKQIIIK
tara:strand:- start:202 stop:1293 length:1092 start_codon:yes stop_codon:yes gene_type:complete